MKITLQNDSQKIVVLILIALTIGLFYSTAGNLISQDGAFYIANAKYFETDFNYAIKMYWPGYPFLIYLFHKFINLFIQTNTPNSWVLCGQAVSFLSWLLSIIPLFFLGKRLVGSRDAFLGLLILVSLPFSIKFATDVLRLWIYILFLSTSMVLLLYSLEKKSNLLFLLTGFTVALGSSIRIECSIILFCALLWFGYCLILPKNGFTRLKSLIFIFLIFCGFTIPSIFFIKQRNEIIPSRVNRYIKNVVDNSKISSSNIDSSNIKYTFLNTENVLRTLRIIPETVLINLMYFFAIFWLIGLYCYFKNLKNRTQYCRFIIAMFILIYIFILTIPVLGGNALSKRYSFPLVAITIFYVPFGIRKSSDSIVKCKKNNWFVIIMVIGLIICFGKLIKTVINDNKKQYYFEIAKWVNTNTLANDKIYSFDPRITLYADRNYVKNYLDSVNYVIKQANEKPILTKDWSKIKEFKEDNKHIIIYENQKLPTSP